MKLAIINPFSKIPKNIKEVVIKKGEAFVDSKRIGKVASPYYLKDFTGIPNGIELPKNLLLLNGKGKVLERFTCSYKSTNSSEGIIIDFRCEIEKTNTITTTEKVLKFNFLDNNSKEANVLLDAFKRTKLLSVDLTQKFDKIFLTYQDFCVASYDVKVLSQLIPSCTGKILSIDKDIIRVKATYDSSAAKTFSDELLDQFKEKYLDIYEYLQLNNISEFHMLKIFLSYRDYGEFKNLIPTPKKLYIDYAEYLQLAVSTVLREKHLRLIGPKSTGKNLFADTLAWVFQRPVLKLSANENLDSYELIGSTSLITKKDEMGNSRTETFFEEHQLLTAMRNGCIFLLDEMNSAESGVLTVLHSVLDDSRSYTLPTGEKIVSDKNFFVLATMNEDYAGLKESNIATEDRFLGLDFDYFDKIIPIIMHDRDQILDISILNSIEQIYGDILERVRNNSLDASCLSVRGFIDIIDLVEDGIDLNKAAKKALCNRSRKEFRDQLSEIIDINLAI